MTPKIEIHAFDHIRCIYEQCQGRSMRSSSRSKCGGPELCARHRRLPWSGAHTKANVADSQAVADGGGCWVEFLVVDLGTEQPASELELFNIEWVGSKSCDSEFLGGAQSGGIWVSFGLIHQDVEVFLSSVLHEGHWVGNSWEVTVCFIDGVQLEFVGNDSSCEAEGLEHSVFV